MIPSWGGEPKQLTFYADAGPMPPRGGFDDWVLGWTKDGKILVRMNRVPWNNRMGRYYVVDPKGGLETPLEIPEGGTASFSPDGTKLAYCPVDREFRTWKRTLGGRAQDVYVYDFASKASERITDWKGTDNFPMWNGDTIWFTSDRDHTLNLFGYDVKTKKTRKATTFTDFDVLWPSLASDRSAIVFMNGGYVWRLDLKTEKAAKIPITLASDRAPLGTAWKDVKENVRGASLSPSGARVILEARGDLFSVPAKDGQTRALTDTPGVREHAPAWSPDGKRVAYLSDATGEYEIYVRAADGSGEPKQLTKDGAPWKFDPAWSPDGKKLAYGDRKHRLRVLDVDSGAIADVDTGTQEDLDTYTWSPDGKWLAYEKSHPTRLPGIAVWSADDEEVVPPRRRALARPRPGILGRRQVPLLPLRARLPARLLGLRVQLRLPARDARLRRRARVRHAVPLPAEERRGEGEGGREEGRKGCRQEGREEGRKEGREGREAREEGRLRQRSSTPRASSRARRRCPASRAGAYPEMAAAPDAVWYVRGRRRRRARRGTRPLPLRPQGAQGREGARRRRGLGDLARRQEDPLSRRLRLVRDGREGSRKKRRGQARPLGPEGEARRRRRDAADVGRRPGGSSATGSTTRRCTAWTGPR